MIIIGIDPGTIICGYGVILVEGSKYTALDYGCIKPPANETLSLRYLFLFDAITELLEKYQPQALAVELQFVFKNVQSAIKLAMARGAVMIASAKKEIPDFGYTPSQAKLAVVGNGKASKHQVQGMIQLLLRLRNPPTPEDAADALALAICHAQSFTNVKNRYKERCHVQLH